ncbi:MAG: TIGR00730 family Rossman fold protein [Chitinophagaceae bacterium]|nr:TIGR00730 family Rossman fold protein [Rubrivivax sp.]
MATEPDPTRPFTVCVYCGSRHGARPAYAAAARQLGQAIGARGWQLVYGGGRVGLMGEVADATLAAGGRVVGVIPESLQKLEVGHLGLHELHVVPTMHLRKQMMAERAHVFVALPGGIGTLEELYEVWTWRQLGYHDQPIGLLNTEGYYDALLAFMRHTVAEGFLSAEQLARLRIDTDPNRMLMQLAGLAGAADAPDDFSRV